MCCLELNNILVNLRKKHCWVIQFIASFFAFEPEEARHSSGMKCQSTKASINWIGIGRCFECAVAAFFRKKTLAYGKLFYHELQDLKCVILLSLDGCAIIGYNELWLCNLLWSLSGPHLTVFLQDLMTTEQVKTCNMYYYILFSSLMRSCYSKNLSFLFNYL